MGPRDWSWKSKFPTACGTGNQSCNRKGRIRPFLTRKLIWVIIYESISLACKTLMKKSQSCLYCFIKINITISKSREFIFFEESCLHLGFHHSGAYQKGSFMVFNVIQISQPLQPIRTRVWKSALLWNPSLADPFFAFPLAKNRMITGFFGYEVSSEPKKFVL